MFIGLKVIDGLLNHMLSTSVLKITKKITKPPDCFEFLIAVWLTREACKIKIWNNGKGIPVVEHQKEKMYVPTLNFGHLLTSSNNEDTEKKVTGQ